MWTQPKVWEGFVRCCQRTKPQSFQVLLQLPAEHLKSALTIVPELKGQLQTHVGNYTKSQVKISSSFTWVASRPNVWLIENVAVRVYLSFDVVIWIWIQWGGKMMPLGVGSSSWLIILSLKYKCTCPSGESVWKLRLLWFWLLMPWIIRIFCRLFLACLFVIPSLSRSLSNNRVLPSVLAVAYS